MTLLTVYDPDLVARGIFIQLLQEGCGQSEMKWSPSYTSLPRLSPQHHSACKLKQVQPCKLCHSPPNTKKPSPSVPPFQRPWPVQPPRLLVSIVPREGSGGFQA